MLIDINAYVGHWPFKQLRYNSCKSLLERMEQFGMQVSLISNLHGIFYKNTQSANEELNDEINSNRDFANRFIPFGVINPIYAGWKEDLEICFEKFGMKGIRLYPLYHDYEIDDPSHIELVKMARDRGMMIAYSLRMVDSRQRSWMDIQKEWELKDVLPIIREVPDAKYMILNIANSMKLKEEELSLLKNAEVLMDISGREISNLGELLTLYGKEKFAFGTHAPILDYGTSLIRIESLRETEASEETKELIRSGNAAKILRI
jgi:predicted TIM-barrel fold metal-dependent hydrolase